jgi:hypothetical protein
MGPPVAKDHATSGAGSASWAGAPGAKNEEATNETSRQAAAVRMGMTVLRALVKMDETGREIGKTAWESRSV